MPAQDRVVIGIAVTADEFIGSPKTVEFFSGRQTHNTSLPSSEHAYELEFVQNLGPTPDWLRKESLVALGCLCVCVCV